MAALLFFFIWVRWTLPRFRYDQLMKLGWIFFFEIALVNIFLTAGLLAYLRQLDHGLHRSTSKPDSGREVYLPAVVAGLAITFKHLKNMLLGQTKVTMQYPEEKWDASMPALLSRRADAGDATNMGASAASPASSASSSARRARSRSSPAKFPTESQFAKVEKFPRNSRST